MVRGGIGRRKRAHKKKFKRKQGARTLTTSGPIKMKKGQMPGVVPSQKMRALMTGRPVISKRRETPLIRNLAEARRIVSLNMFELEQFASTMGKDPGTIRAMAEKMVRDAERNR